MAKMLRCGYYLFCPQRYLFCLAFWFRLYRFYLSFCKFITISDAKPVGLDNYVAAFSDSQFAHAFLLALFALVSTVLITDRC